jgi:hypothetical protein
MTKETATPTVSLRYTLSPLVVRTVGEYTWSADNGHVADVPLELAADLLTSRESASWELAARPSAKVQKELAEMMGLAPAELIQTSGDEPEGEVKHD